MQREIKKQKCSSLTNIVLTNEKKENLTKLNSTSNKQSKKISPIKEHNFSPKKLEEILPEKQKLDEKPKQEEIKDYEIISFNEAFNYFLSKFYNSNSDLNKIYCYDDSIENVSFINRYFFGAKKIFKLESELKSEYKFILFLSTEELNLNDIVIYRVLITIYFYFVIDDKEKTPSKQKLLKFIENSYKKSENYFECHKLILSTSKYVDDFNKKINCLMLLQLLFLIDKYSKYLNDKINDFKEDKEKLIYISFYFSWICLERMTHGILNLYFNNKKNLIDVFNEFYLGIIDYFFSKNYIDQYNSDYTNIFFSIINETYDTPSSFLWNVKKIKIKYPYENNQSILSSFFSCSNVNL